MLATQLQTGMVFTHEGLPARCTVKSVTVTNRRATITFAAKGTKDTRTFPPNTEVELCQEPKSTRPAQPTFRSQFGTQSGLGRSSFRDR